MALILAEIAKFGNAIIKSKPHVEIRVVLLYLFSVAAIKPLRYVISENKTKFASFVLKI